MNWLNYNVFPQIGKLSISAIGPHDVLAAVAHAVKDPNGRAYDRTAHLPARREMMPRRADYLDKLRMGSEGGPVGMASGRADLAGVESRSSLGRTRR